MEQSLIVRCLFGLVSAVSVGCSLEAAEPTSHQQSQKARPPGDYSSDDVSDYGSDDTADEPTDDSWGPPGDYGGPDGGSYPPGNFYDGGKGWRADAATLEPSCDEEGDRPATRFRCTVQEVVAPGACVDGYYVPQTAVHACQAIGAQLSDIWQTDVPCQFGLGNFRYECCRDYPPLEEQGDVL